MGNVPTSSKGIERKESNVKSFSSQGTNNSLSSSILSDTSTIDTSSTCTSTSQPTRPVAHSECMEQFTGNSESSSSNDSFANKDDFPTPNTTTDDDINDQPMNGSSESGANESDSRNNSLNILDTDVIRQPRRGRSFSGDRYGSASKKSGDRYNSGKLLYATLEWLVVAMTDCSRPDITIRDVVLLLHPSFCTSYELAAALIERYNVCSDHEYDFQLFLKERAEKERKVSKQKKYQKNNGVGEQVGIDNEDEDVEKEIVLRTFRNHVLRLMGTEEIENLKSRSTSPVASKPSRHIRAISTPVETTTSTATMSSLATTSINNTTPTTTDSILKSSITTAASTVTTNTVTDTTTTTTTTTPSTPSFPNNRRITLTIPGDTPDKKLLRVRLKVLIIFSKWIKSDMFYRDVQREESITYIHDNMKLSLLVLIRAFLMYIKTQNSNDSSKGKKMMVDSLLKHLQDIEQQYHETIQRTRKHAADATTNSANVNSRTSNILPPPSLPSLLFPKSKIQLLEAMYSNLQPSEEAVHNPSQYLYRFTPKEIAMNLTVMAYHEITQVNARDLINKKFNRGTKKVKKLNSPSVFYVIDSFNDRVRWVCAVLLFNEIGTPGDRAATISFWVDVAYECVTLYNYQTALVIMSAFSSPCMSIVSNNMNILSEKQKIKYDNMKLLMSAENKYLAYRHHLMNSNGKPHIIAFPVLTQDLIRVEDGNKTYHNDNKLLIHIDKFYKIFHIIDNLMNSAENGYNIINGSSSNNDTSGSNTSNGSNDSNGSSNVRIVDGDGSDHDNSNVLISQPGLIHLLSHWLYPPPSNVELYKTASRVLAKENQNMLETLDYLGL